ncbi:nucleotidyltransferase family protein [Metabacillus fastidiosus]|uniref:nucleotidyltransferase domain-containing protein n=1 Tax=Metabacillus fastidiosus TaxID=1458 RepID=UPI002DBFB263|nr:nucleotidyltransferase family protein [Metabacillus fastidiosus]MEC2076076.1 nucleotidyltransferase family protein [Metabacillus fastidiosus]
MKNKFSLNLSSVPKELKLIIEIIKIEEEKGIQEISEDLLENINWEEFLQLAMHHRVYSLLYSRMNKTSRIPSEVVQSLNRKYQKNIFKMLSLSGEMEQICRIFGESQIKSLVLKGPVLAADLYGDLSLRTSRDLDILIPFKDLSKADQVLTNLGYEKEELQTLFNDWKWKDHHISYYHPKKQMHIEVHWKMHPGASKEPDFRELWARKRTCTHFSHSVYFLGREDLFLFLALHGARHGWSRLRWLIDIHQLMKQNLNWDEIFALSKKYKSTQVEEQALILSSQLLNSYLPKTVKVRSWKLAQSAIFYYERMINLHNGDPLPLKLERYHMMYLMSLKSLSSKFLFIISFLFPTYKDKETLKLPRTFYFLYFPLRPVLVTVRKITSLK